MRGSFTIALASLPWIAVVAEPQADPGKPLAPLSLVVELTDGSRFIGTAEIDTLPFIAKYGRMELVMKEVASVTLGEDRETGRIAMKNGDSLQGVLDIGDLKLRTLLGEISVPIRHVSRIAITRAPIARGLVLYYSFDYKDEIARDISGKGDHGKIHEAKWTPDGKVGGAYEFDGKTAYIQRDHDERSEVFPKNAPFSVAAWFRTSASLPIQPSIFASYYVTRGHGEGYHLILNNGAPGGRMQWCVATGARELVNSKMPVNDGRWHHAVGAWDGEKSYLYVDGILQGSAKVTGPIPYTRRQPFRIGCLYSAPPAMDRNYYFGGTIDEVMVFNRALSAKEVQFLWKSP